MRLFSKFFGKKKFNRNIGEDIKEKIFLMCPPDFYDTHFLFNPWMSYRQKVNRQKAKNQWQKLKKTIEELGAKIKVIKPNFRESAMVFVRDGGLIFQPKKVLILPNPGLRGKREPKIFSSWFKKQGFKIYHPPKNIFFEGGNILFLKENILICGLRPGENPFPYQWLQNFLSKEKQKLIKIFLVYLTNERYLHLDMVISPLKEKVILVYPDGLNVKEGWQKHPLWQQRKVIVVDEKDAKKFGCNGIIIKETFITDQISEKLENEIKKTGTKVEKLDLSEFHKAGGGIHCLTLELN